jgi:hypothetical protein
MFFDCGSYFFNDSNSFLPGDALHGPWIERKSHADTVSEALKPGMIWHDPDKWASPPICRL